MGVTKETPPPSSFITSTNNARLIDIAKEKQAKLAPAFIDNITFLGGGKNFSITHAKINSMMTQQNGAYEWSREHNSFFEKE